MLHPAAAAAAQLPVRSGQVLHANPSISSCKTVSRHPSKRAPYRGSSRKRVSNLLRQQNLFVSSILSSCSSRNQHNNNNSSSSSSNSTSSSSGSSSNVLSSSRNLVDSGRWSRWWSKTLSMLRQCRWRKRSAGPAPPRMGA